MEEQKTNVQDKAPKWVEFLRVESEEEMTTVAAKFFGGDFKGVDVVETFGMELGTFTNFYVEVGLVFAPDGPLVPGKVAPILVLKQQEDGGFKPHVFRSSGFHDMQGKRAWIKAPEWDELLGDTLYNELEEKYSGQDVEEEKE